MKISMERTETAGNGSPMSMHWMGNSFLCSEYMKTQKQLLGLWFSDFGGDAVSADVNAIDPIPQKPTTLTCSPWLFIVDAGAGIVAVGYAGILALRLLSIL